MHKSLQEQQPGLHSASPKRNQPAYTLCIAATRDALKKPGMSVVDVHLEAMVVWGRMGATEKEACCYLIMLPACLYIIININ